MIGLTVLAQGIADTLAHLGRERANYNACPPNNLKLVDTCDCTDIAVCEDVYSDVVAAARSFAGFTYVLNGVTRVFSVLQPIEAPDGSGLVLIPVRGLIPVTDPESIHEWMLQVLSIFEVESGLVITWTLAGTIITYNHTGAGAITVITYDDASTDTPDARNCTLGVCCDYVLGKEGTMGDISDDGGASTETLANEPYNYTGIQVTDDAEAIVLAADLQTY